MPPGTVVATRGLGDGLRGLVSREDSKPPRFLLSMPAAPAGILLPMRLEASKICLSVARLDITKRDERIPNDRNKEPGMKFQQYDLRHRQKNSIVEVKLSGTEANVQLLDSLNLQHYKAGRDFQYYGGHYKQSPVHLTIPHAGTWYVIIDLGGYGGYVSSSVRVIA